MVKTTPSSRYLPAHVSLSKSGVYRYRRRVPDDLRETVGKREIKKSLGKDRTVALREHALLEAKVEKLFAQKPGKPARNSNISIKILSKLEEHGFGPDALAELRRGIDDDNEDLFYALDEVLEELERDPEIPEHAVIDVSRGRLTFTLEAALDDYREHKEAQEPRRQRVISQTVERNKRRLLKYLGKEAVAKQPLNKLRRENARRFVEGLLSEASPATARRILNDINAAVNRAILEFDLDMSNPFARLDTKGGKHTRDSRLPLDDDDMERLAPVMETADDLGTIWVTLRDTGARLNEIVGLRGCDVDGERKTIWIRPHEARPIKTANSAREVPIPEIALEKLKARKTGKAEAPLFPRYMRERGADTCSQTLMKRFRKVIKEPRKAVYSLRHRMKDLLRDTDCPEDIAREIMGHSDQSSAANYGRGYSIERKRRALEKAWVKNRASGGCRGETEDAA